MQTALESIPEAQETTFSTYCLSIEGHSCGRLISRAVVPWEGAPEKSSHGICADCLPGVERAIEDLDLVQCANCEKPAAPRKDPNDEPLCHCCERVLFEPSFDPRDIALVATLPRPRVTRDLSPQSNRKPFGTGFAEIRSSAIVQVLGNLAAPLTRPNPDPRSLFYFGAVCALLLVGAIADVVL